MSVTIVSGATSNAKALPERPHNSTAKKPLITKTLPKYPFIDVAAKIADALNVTVDYLVGHSDNLIMDKNLVRRMEDIEALPN